MKLRSIPGLLAILILSVLLMGATAWADDEKPPIDLPTYPGSQSSMEVNLTNEDILPMLKAMLPMMSGRLGVSRRASILTTSRRYLKDVKRIEMVQLDITKSGITQEDVVNFYAKNLPAGNWTRLFWQNGPSSGMMAVYTRVGMDGFYGFRVQSLTIDGKPAKRVMVAKTDGKIDFVKLIGIAGKCAQAGQKAD